MKYIVLIMTLISGTAFADSNNEKTIQWLSKQSNGNPYVKFVGKTPSGQGCALYVSDKGDNNYFVVVGFHDSPKTKNMNNFIGLGIMISKEHAKSAMGEDYIILNAKDSWGNLSTANNLIIDLKSDGSPWRAIGTSDLLKMSCQLRGTAIPYQPE